MSTTPPEQEPPIPPGYKPGDYIPYNDRDPNSPTSIAGQWADPALQAQQGDGARMTHEEHYRAIYGNDAPTRVTYASWGRRVLGYLVDTFLGGVASIPLLVGYWMLIDDAIYTTDVDGTRRLESVGDVGTTTIAVLVVGVLVSLAFNVWNVVIRQGHTGYSLGKTVVGIRLVKISTGQPMGPGLCFVRQLAHYVDSLVCYLGWLWPLWDSRKQTLGDKIMNTVVIILPQDQAQL